MLFRHGAIQHRTPFRKSTALEAFSRAAGPFAVVQQGPCLDQQHVHFAQLIRNLHSGTNVVRISSF